MPEGADAESYALCLVKFFAVDVDQRLTHALEILIALLQEAG